MPPTVPSSPVADAGPDPDSARTGPQSAIRLAILALAGCALAALALTMLLYSGGAGDAVVAALAVPLALGMALLAIDFAWTPWRAAQAERRRRDAEAAEPPPAFDDTQATWRLPLAGEPIAEAPLRT